MQTFSAIDQAAAIDARDIAFVVFPGMALLDLAGPLQVLSWARASENDGLAYRIRILSQSGGVIQTDSYLTLETEPLLNYADHAFDTLIVVGGDGVYLAEKDQEFVDGIRTLADLSRRVCSVCSGAYLLARAGCLDQRRVTTHWEDIDILRKDFPDLHVESDPIYIKDDHIWTSAGVTSGTDMSIAIVAEDLGHGAALSRARALVTYMVRPGGQSQFSPVLERQRRDAEGRFSKLHEWISENLQKDLTIEALAEHQNMSLRSFHRAYQTVMGTTPAKAVAAIRLERAREMLETSSLHMKAIAFQCGFKTEEHMRRSFLRQLGVVPSEYRARFQMLEKGDRSWLEQ